MDAMTILFKCSIFFNVIYTLVALKCNPYGKCGCVLEDNSRVIDLSPMIGVAGKTPMFQKVPDSASMFTYDIDFCQSFTCGSGKSKACFNALGIKLSIGKDSSFEYDNSGVVTFVYTDTTQKATTRIVMHCSTKDGLGNLDSITSSHQDSLFTTKLTSKYACFKPFDGGGKSGSKSHGLSVGSILCIALLVLITVYVIGGIVINKYLRKFEGESYLPNKSFWKDFPSLVKDGFIFTRGKLKKSEEYEKI